VDQTTEDAVKDLKVDWRRWKRTENIVATFVASGANTAVPRRDLLRTVMAGAAAAAITGTAAFEATTAEPRSSGDKRKARYRANSAEVQDFYRVNRYPAQ
jgi:hypothetical protein